MAFFNALSAVSTEKGAKSLGSTGSSRVDFFFKVLRSTESEEVQRLLSRSYSESPSDTAKLVFHLRDCRGGKGERKPFIDCLKWYLKNGRSDFVRKVLGLIPFYGYWKDLNALFGTSVEDDVATLYAKVLQSDLLRMKNNESISLAGKWAPSEGSKPDRTHKAAEKIAKILFPKVVRYSVRMQLFRKIYLSPLRSYSNVTEVYMCGKMWDQIKYEQVPSVCMLTHRKAFSKNDEVRFQEYLAKVKSGEAKINATQLFPYQLVAHYLRGKDYDETIEMQWKALVNHHRQMGTFKKCLPVCDVSGSMTTPVGPNTDITCLEACIGLGLLMSECVDAPFDGKVFTFSSVPKLHHVKGVTLKNRVQDIKSMEWQMTTNFQAIFDMILSRCTQEAVPAEEMPQTLFVFSDMQFDAARFCPIHHKPTTSGHGGYSNGTCNCPSNTLTNLQVMKQKYTSAGYAPPQVVFWNLRGNTPDFPASANENGIALVSGFSPTLMQLFMKGAEMTPFNIMRVAIDDERYSLIEDNSEFVETDDDVLYRGKKAKRAKTEADVQPMDVDEDEDDIKIVKTL